jgi:hypothetical protein
MFDFEDVIMIENLDESTLVRCRRDGLTWNFEVKNSVDEIYDMLDYEDLHED